MKAFKRLSAALIITGLVAAIAPKALAKPGNGNGNGNAGNTSSSSGGHSPSSSSSASGSSNTASQQVATLTCANGSVTGNPLAGGSFLSYSKCLTMSGNDVTSSISADLTAFLNTTLGTGSWVSGGKYDSGQLSFLPSSSGVESKDLGFSWLQTGKGKGTWSLSQAITTPFVISLKAGTAYTAYYVDGGASFSSGTWATFDQKNLSHASIFVAKGSLNSETPKTTVPEPGSTAALVLVGLSAVGVVRRKQA